jgi:twitching motility protein PilT
MARIDQLLEYTRKVGGSDLHLSVGSPPLIRLHGELKPTGTTPLGPQDTLRLIGEILSEEQRRLFGEKNNVDLGYELRDIGRFRVNVLRQRKGVDACFRVIPDELPDARQIGLPEALIDLTRLAKGLVLVTGPSGCGKSTTLAALINEINEHRAEHIITLEDPIEFIHPARKSMVNQRAVGAHTASFARALRAALREDPDVILVGEMRDLETMQLAVTAAETGHLVFGTLNTSSAHKTVDRIIGSFPAEKQNQIRAMVAASLRGAVTQLLLPRAQGGGRVPAFEVVLGTTAVSKLIREGRTHQIPSVIQTSAEIGMCLMDQSLADLVQQGLVEPEVAYYRARDQKTFRKLLPPGFKDISEQLLAQIESNWRDDRIMERVDEFLSKKFMKPPAEVEDLGPGSLRAAHPPRGS